MGLFDNFFGASGANPQYQMQGYGGFPMSPAAMPNYPMFQPAPDGQPIPARSPFRLISQTVVPNDTGGGQDSTSPQRPQIFSAAEKQASGYNDYRPVAPQGTVTNDGRNYPNEFTPPLDIFTGRQTNDGAAYPNYFDPRDVRPASLPDGTSYSVGLRRLDANGQPTNPQQVSADGRVVNGVYDDRFERSSPNGTPTITGSLPPGNANGPYSPSNPPPQQANGQGSPPMRPIPIPASLTYADPGAPTTPFPTDRPPPGATPQTPNPTYSNTPAPYIKAVKGFEGYAPAAKWDFKQNSNGFGTKALYPGERITPQEAERRFQVEWGNAAGQVDKFKPGMPEGVRAALTSLTYNSGTKWMNSGLGHAIANGDYFAAKQHLLHYTNAGGRPNAGLIARRQQEASWMNSAILSQKVANGAVNGFWKRLGGQPNV